MCRHIRAPVLNQFRRSRSVKCRRRSYIEYHLHFHTTNSGTDGGLAMLGTFSIAVARTVQGYVGYGTLSHRAILTSRRVNILQWQWMATLSLDVPRAVSTAVFRQWQQTIDYILYAQYTIWQRNLFSLPRVRNSLFWSILFRLFDYHGLQPQFGGRQMSEPDAIAGGIFSSQHRTALLTIFAESQLKCLQFLTSVHCGGKNRKIPYGTQFHMFVAPGSHLYGAEKGHKVSTTTKCIPWCSTQ